MKMMKLTFLMCLLTAFGAHAITMQEVTDRIPRNVSVNFIKKNVDGSVTFTDVKLLRGDMQFFLAASGSYGQNTCTLLGFDTALVDANLSLARTERNSEWMVVIDENGKYQSTIKTRNAVSKVTCVNEGDLKPMVDFDKVENPDGSWRITNVKYHRGDMEFFVSSASKDFSAACKLLGFEYSLEGGPTLNNIQNIQTFTWMVNISNEGGFSQTIKSKYYFDKLTCFSGTEPDVIVIVDGQRYRTTPPSDDPTEPTPEEPAPEDPSEDLPEEEMPEGLL
jgi:hypothetical protein